MTKSPGSRKFVPSGFFTMRTPLLPVDDFLGWSEGIGSPSELSVEELEESRRRLRDRLGQLLKREELMEAFYLASPTLVSRIDEWRRAPDSAKGRSIERSLVRYLSRMSLRATPFGLFAGCSVGTIGESTALALSPRRSYSRRTRLDMGYLLSVYQDLVDRPSTADQILFRTNPTLYEAGGKLRYVGARFGRAKRAYVLSAVDPDEYLETVLTCAGQPQDVRALTTALSRSHPDVDPSSAMEFVRELIAAELLVPELQVPLTGGDPLGDLIEEMQQLPSLHQISSGLAAVREGLQAIDREGIGASLDSYRAIVRSLEELPVVSPNGQLLQVDLYKPVAGAELGSEVISEILRGANLLRRLGMPPRGTDRLQSFVRRFGDRFGDREIGLLEALDEEAGVGYGKGEATAGTIPLIEGLPFDGSSPPESALWGSQQETLLRLLTEALGRGEREIHLSQADIVDLSPAIEPPPLPDAFAVTAALRKLSSGGAARGGTQVVLRRVFGPSGARVLGRFCDGDAVLCERVREHLRQEEQLDADAIFAEVVHLPDEQRHANVVIRPLLRRFELPYLGASGASRANQIPLNEIGVRVVGAEARLRWRRTGQDLRPRISNAYAYGRAGSGLYQFLGDLQGQGRSSFLTWSWGALGRASFLPRVSHRGLVLGRARWRIPPAGARSIAGLEGRELHLAVQKIRRRHGLPRLSYLREGDLEMPVDLDNLLSVESLADRIRRNGGASLVEMLPGPDELVARGPEGSFVSELVVPFVREGPRQPALELPAPSSPRRSRSWDAAEERRVFTPGSEWLYAKLVTSPATADRILREVLPPLIEQLADRGALERWFFLRYGDPEWHLRLRFGGRPRALLDEVLPSLHERLQPLVDSRALSAWQLDTYDREIERYGGARGVEVAEEIFHVDSRAVLAVLSSLEASVPLEVRSLLGLVGIDRLLAGLGLDLTERLVVISDLRTYFTGHFKADVILKRKVGARSREIQDRVGRLVAVPAEALPPPFRAAALIFERSFEPLVHHGSHLRELERRGHLERTVHQIAASLVHLHVNRLLRSGHRRQELVLYEVLFRMYRQVLSTAGNGVRSAVSRRE